MVFVLATTDPKKIPPTVLSRCQRFDFRPIPAELLTRGLTEILTQEKVRVRPGGPAAAGARGGGQPPRRPLAARRGHRLRRGRLEEASVARLLGASSPVQVRALAGALLARDGAAALEAIDRAARQGEDLAGYCRDVVEMLRRLLVVKVAPASPPAELTPAEVQELKAAAEPATVDDLVYLLRALLEAQAEMPRSPHPRVELEIAAVRATPPPSAAVHRDVDQQSRGSRAADPRRRRRWRGSRASAIDAGDPPRCARVPRRDPAIHRPSPLRGEGRVRRFRAVSGASASTVAAPPLAPTLSPQGRGE